MWLHVKQDDDDDDVGLKVLRKTQADDDDDVELKVLTKTQADDDDDDLGLTSSQNHSPTLPLCVPSED